MATNRYTLIELEIAVRTSKTWADVCRQIGVKPLSGSQTYIKRKCITLGYDLSHFTGQAWASGVIRDKKDLAPFLITGGPKINSNSLRMRLIRDGYKESKCEICGLSKWCGENIVLELDHKNSDHFDNALENLQILCSNCHALKTRKAALLRRKKAVTSPSQIEQLSIEKFKKTVKSLAQVELLKIEKLKKHESKIKTEETQLHMQEERKILLLESTIDFSKFGWVTEAATLLKMHPQKINTWIKKRLPEFYAEKCYKRKSIGT